MAGKRSVVISDAKVQFEPKPNRVRTRTEPEVQFRFGVRAELNPKFSSGSGNLSTPEPGSNPNLKLIMTHDLLD
jgi:hypothetical protein